MKKIDEYRAIRFTVLLEINWTFLLELSLSSKKFSVEKRDQDKKLIVCNFMCSDCGALKLSLFFDSRLIY